MSWCEDDDDDDEVDDEAEDGLMLRFGLLAYEEEEVEPTVAGGVKTS